MKKIFVSLIMFLVVSGLAFGVTFSDFQKMPVGTNEEKLAKIKVAESLLPTNLTEREKELTLSFLTRVNINFDKNKALEYANQLETFLGRKVNVKGVVLYGMVGKAAETISYFKDFISEGKAPIGEIRGSYWYLYTLGKRTKNTSLALESARGLLNSLSYFKSKAVQEYYYGWTKIVLPTALKGLNVSEQVNLLVKVSKNFDNDIRGELISLAVSKITTSDLVTVEQVSLFLNCEKVLSISDNADLISQIFSEISRKTGIKEVNELEVENWIQENK